MNPRCKCSHNFAGERVLLSQLQGKDACQILNDARQKEYILECTYIVIMLRLFLRTCKLFHKNTGDKVLCNDCTEDLFYMVMGMDVRNVELELYLKIVIFQLVYNVLHDMNKCVCTNPFP